MINSEEVERYKQVALTVAAGREDQVSAKERNLAVMVIELVRIVDHLCAVVLAGVQQVDKS